MNSGVMNTLKNLSKEKLSEFRSQLYSISWAETAKIFCKSSVNVCVHGKARKGALTSPKYFEDSLQVFLTWTQIYKWRICIQVFRDLKQIKWWTFIYTPCRLLCFVGKQYHLISTCNFITFSKFKESILFKQVRYLYFCFNWHL